MNGKALANQHPEKTPVSSVFPFSSIFKANVWERPEAGLVKSATMTMETRPDRSHHKATENWRLLVTLTWSIAMPVKLIDRGVPQWEFCEDLDQPGEIELSSHEIGTPENPTFHGIIIPELRFFRMFRVLIQSIHSSRAESDSFFGIDALPNGLMIQVLDQNQDIVEDFGTGLRPITRHYNFGILAGVDVSTDTGANKSAIGIRWTIASTGEPFILQPLWTFRFVVQDDLTELDSLEAQVQGLISPP